MKIRTMIEILELYNPDIDIMIEYDDSFFPIEAGDIKLEKYEEQDALIIY